jgi:GT2 family glycosyltransferase
MTPEPLVSVFVTCCGQLEYTRLCLPSVLRHGGTAFELLCLDAGSLDGTADYLAGFRDAAAVRVEVARAATDAELPAACRDLLGRGRGDYLVLLNNDTVVTAGWLTHLVGLAELAPEVGLVGPMSNGAAPPQRVDAVPYRLGPQRRPGGVPEWVVDTTAVDRFAAAFREHHRGRWIETDRLGGFCLLVKRAVLAALGPLDGKAGLGVFDTDALCGKAREAGFRLACCGDLFVHHFASRAFAQGGPAA